MDYGWGRSSSSSSLVVDVVFSGVCVCVVWLGLGPGYYTFLVIIFY